MRLELNESFGTTTTLTYQNQIIKTGEDKEQRILPWEKPLLTFDISKTVLDQIELDYLINFFRTSKGQAGYFRFKDYTDFNCTRYDFDTGLGIITRGYLNPNGDGISTQFQVCKVYYIFDTNIASWRPITRIDERFPVEIFINDVLTTNYSLNYDTGIVTFSVAPPNGAILTINCEFEVWCRFGQDNLEYKILTGENIDTLLYGIDSLKILESRESSLTIYKSGYIKHHSHTLAVSFTLDQVGGDTYSTQVEDLSSGFSLETATRNTYLRNFKTGERYLSYQEIQYLIALYRICRGTGSTFLIEEQSGNYRFDNDLSILIETIDLQREEYIYLAQSNTLQEVIEIDSSLSIIGQNAVVTTSSYYKDPIYWGFTAANGAESCTVVIENPIFNNTTLSPNFTLVGTSQNLGGNNFQLVTIGQKNTKAAIWSFATDFSATTSFSLSFQYTINFKGFSDNGFFDGFTFNGFFDGFTFAIQAQGGNALQSSTDGGGLGYIGIAPSIAVEVDGYRNSWDGINRKHLGININGNVSSLTWSEIKDDQDVNIFWNNSIDATTVTGYMWIEYDGVTLSAFMSPNSSRPSTAKISYAINFNDFFPKIESTSVAYEQGDTTEVGMGIYPLAHCWKITRTDGVIITLTNHDSILFVDGLTYSPLAAPTTTSLSFSTALNVDNTELSSILTSEFINESDILGGKFDYALVDIFIVDYTSSGIIKNLVSGYIGEITTTNRLYTAEVRGYAQHLQKKQLKVTTKTCPLIFGEQGQNKCNKDLTGLVETTTITEVSGQQKFKIGSGHVNDFYTNGVVEWVSGKNQGIRMDIALYKNNEITVWESLPYAIEVGDQVKMTAGCPKTFDACIGFNNISNFGGDPFLPGNDYYLAGVLNIK